MFFGSESRVSNMTKSPNDYADYAILAGLLGQILVLLLILRLCSSLQLVRLLLARSLPAFAQTSQALQRHLWIVHITEIYPQITSARLTICRIYIHIYIHTYIYIIHIQIHIHMHVNIYSHIIISYLRSDSY